MSSGIRRSVRAQGVLMLVASLGAVLCLLASPVRAQPAAVPLLSFPREGFENAVWLNDRVKMGGEYVQGTIQGLGGATDSVMMYKLDGKYEVFESTVGYVDGAPSGRSAVFEVWADGVKLFTTESIASGEAPDVIRVPVKDRQVLQLRIRPDRYDCTHGAAFGQPMLYNGVGPDFVGTLVINRDGKRDRIVGGARRKEIDVTVPLKPGYNEYTVRVRYDEKAGRVDIETRPAGGIPPGPTPAPATPPNAPAQPPDVK